MMTIFFAATTGFQIPVSEFGNYLRVIRNACILFLGADRKTGCRPAFDSKVGSRCSVVESGTHLRECAVMGLSMAEETEFAFIVAVFGVIEQWTPPGLYVSVVLAILLSKIIAVLCCFCTLLAAFPIVTKVNGDQDSDVRSVQSQLPVTSGSKQQEA